MEWAYYNAAWMEGWIDVPHDYANDQEFVSDIGARRTFRSQYVYFKNNTIDCIILKLYVINWFEHIRVH